MMTKRLMRSRRAGGFASMFAIVVAAAGLATAEQAPRGRGAMMGDPAHMDDMRQIHELLGKGTQIRRTVTLRSDGVETTTESDDPALAATIRTHVASMYRRIQEQRPIHQRDPLFRAIFDNAAKISFVERPTATGITIVETSDDAYVVKLIQAHAEVLGRFLANGHAEAMKNHEVPPRE